MVVSIIKMRQCDENPPTSICSSESLHMKTDDPQASWTTLGDSVAADGNAPTVLQRYQTLQ